MLDANPQGRTRVIVQQPAQPPQPPQRTLLAPPAPHPGSQDELHALAMKRSELQSQLEALTDRREEIADQLHGAETQARPGILARLQVLDERITKLEAEVLQTDDAITAGLSAGLVMPPGEQTETLFEPPPEFPRFSEESINIMAGEALAFVLLAIALYKLGWRRAKRKFAGAAPNDSGRMDQLQNAVDAIAVEIERISEGQRYVTKRLNEGTAGAEPISVGQEEAIPVRKRAT
jgi:hypothetical protein